jgi:hypothetical protein
MLLVLKSVSQVWVIRPVIILAVTCHDVTIFACGLSSVQVRMMHVGEKVVYVRTTYSVMFLTDDSLASRDLDNV